LLIRQITKLPLKVKKRIKVKKTKTHKHISNEHSCYFFLRRNAVMMMMMLMMMITQQHELESRPLD